MGEMVMMTVRGLAENPSVEDVAKMLGVPVSAIDAKFGIIIVDVERHICTVRVDSDQLPKDTEHSEGVSGPYSDPKIAPFGTPEPDDG